MTDTSKHQVTEEHAAKFREWIATRGGLFVWRSIDLSDPGKTVVTPARDSEGNTCGKPGWQFANEPARHITSEADVEVCIDKVVKRFHVGTERSRHGMYRFDVTGAGSRRIRAEVEKAGKVAYYTFDYGSYENCIIMAPEKVIPLPEWQPAPPAPSEENSHEQAHT